MERQDPPQVDQGILSIVEEMKKMSLRERDTESQSLARQLNSMQIEEGHGKPTSPQIFSTIQNESKLLDKLVWTLYELLRADMTQSRRLVETGLINAIQQLMSTKKPSEYVFYLLLMVLCMPTHVMTDREIIQFFNRLHLDSFFSEYLLRETREYTSIDQEMDLQMLRVIEKFVYASADDKEHRIVLNNIATALYLIISREVTFKHEIRVTQKACKLLAIIQHRI